MTLLTFLLTLALVARGTRLLTTDTITAPLRDLISKNLSVYTYGEYSEETNQIVKRPWTLLARVRNFVAKMLECDWCTSIWVAAAVTPLGLDEDVANSYPFQFFGILAALSFLGTLAITVHDAADRHANY